MAHGLYEAIALPHPPISPRVFLVVERALRAAWRILRDRCVSGFDLLTAVENRITRELQEVLCDQVFNKGLVAGFDRELFAKPTRDSKVVSYDGRHPDKMPDLLLDLVNRPPVAKPSQDWLFIECKPLDREHPAGSCYCDKGLIRFVNGDYAWAMQEAMMIGYASEGYTIRPKLDDALRDRRDEIPTGSLPKPCHGSEATLFGERVHVSKHGRTFPYVETGVQAPDITIRHLWLRRD